jgi:hypothetical protein
MVACGDSGRSFQESYADSPVTHAFSAIVDTMTSLIAQR